MTINSINLAQKLVAKNKTNSQNVSFRGGEAPDLDSLRAKQDEFRRMSEQVGEQSGVLGKFGKLATKAIGVVIAFTAAKICLDKAAGMIGGAVGKYVDSAVTKVAEKATEKAAGKSAEEVAKITASVTKYTEKMTKFKEIGEKVQKYAVNVIAGGAAVGTALKDFGLVNKQVSSATDEFVNNAIDNDSYSGYNSSRNSDDYNVNEDEF